jgi:hypothetical protein
MRANYLKKNFFLIELKKFPIAGKELKAYITIAIEAK